MHRPDSKVREHFLPYSQPLLNVRKTAVYSEMCIAIRLSERSQYSLVNGSSGDSFTRPTVALNCATKKSSSLVSRVCKSEGAEVALNLGWTISRINRSANSAVFIEFIRYSLR